MSRNIHTGRRGQWAWRSRRGSASALIVLMVVLLAVFAALALSAAAANLRMAQSHADWSADFYRLDARAERFLAAVDHQAMAGDDAAASEQRVAAVRVDGVTDVICRREVAALWIAAVAGDPQARGIEVRLRWPIGADGNLATDSPVVTGWRQFQQPFVYGDEPGGLWDGEDK